MARLYYTSLRTVGGLNRRYCGEDFSE